MSPARRHKRFVRFLSAEDVVDMELEMEPPRVVAFALNYRAHVAGAWREVVRYDTAHGGPHLHRFWEDPGARPWPGPRRLSLAQAADWADADIRARWREYRAYLEGVA